LETHVSIPILRRLALKKAALRKRARQSYVRLMRCPGAPREVAGGLAVGLFVSMLPMLHTLLALGFVEVFRRVTGIRLSRVAAAIGVWASNPLTAAPHYAAAYALGLPVARLIWAHPISGASQAMVAVSHFGSAGPAALQVLFTLVVGGALMGIPLAAVGYFLMRSTVSRYQTRRGERRVQPAPLRPQLVG
jgi:uncharacterized protein (DUF2062 family)